MIRLPVIYGVHFLIIGNGSVQASVTERPIALPPTTARECAMPDQPTQVPTREGLLAATAESLAFFIRYLARCAKRLGPAINRCVSAAATNPRWRSCTARSFSRRSPWRWYCLAPRAETWRLVAEELRPRRSVVPPCGCFTAGPGAHRYVDIFTDPIVPAIKKSKARWATYRSTCDRQPDGPWGTSQ